MGNSRFDGAIERRLQSGEKAFLLQSVLKTGAQGQSSGQDLPQVHVKCSVGRR
jgi:hypothetical protein